MKSLTPLALLICLCVFHTNAVILDTLCSRTVTVGNTLVDEIYCGSNSDLEKLVCDREKGNRCLGLLYYSGCSDKQCATGYFCSNNVCLNCPSGCGYCESNDKCILCKSGYYAKNGTQCDKIPGENCVAAYFDTNTNVTRCQTCLRGYYLNTGSDYATMPCKKCPNGCSSCSEEGTCDLGGCGVGKYWDTETKTCVDGIKNCLLDTGKATDCNSCNYGYYKYTDASGIVTCAPGTANCAYVYPLGACKQCASQYYLNAAGACTQINFPYCDITVTGSDCKSCISGFFLENTCSKLIDEHCVEALSATDCKKCSAGYFVDTTQTPQCQACYSTTECAACTSVKKSDCTVCQPGYVLYSNFKCQACYKGCKTCTSSLYNACSACKPGYWYTDAQKTCTNCGSHCATCKSATECLACEDGYQLGSGLCYKCADTGNCATCTTSGCSKAGYASYISGGLAYSCPSGCSKCTSDTQCTECDYNYYIKNGLCESCGDGCVDCRSDGCYGADTGWFLRNKKALNCGGGFGEAACLNSNCQASGCVSVKAGFYLSDGIPYACDGDTPAGTCTSCDSTNGCSSAASGFYVANKVANLCPSGCSTCTSGTVCTSCISGTHFLKDGKCTACGGDDLTMACDTNYCTVNGCTQAAAGYYINDGVAYKCSSGCKTCANGICTECYQSYFMNNGACKKPENCKTGLDAEACQVCDEGYWVIENTQGIITKPCVECYVKNCAECADPFLDICMTCKPGYFLSADQKSCGTGKCDEHCLLCASGNTCSKCAEGYYLSGNNCSPCYDTTKCLTCSGPQITDCTACKTSYGYVQGEGCILCTNNEYNTVATCKPKPKDSDGKYIDSAYTATVSCISGSFQTPACAGRVMGCKTANSRVTCATCLTGYYLQAPDYICKACDVNGCQACKEQGKCTQCQDGYFLGTAGNCISCTQKNCAKCNNPTDNGCVGCNPGYRLANGVCSQCGEGDGPLDCSCGSGKFWNSTTKACAPCINACITCTNAERCSVCNSDYYLDSVTYKCNKATDTGCAVTLPMNVCKTCIASHFYNTANSSCDACSDKYKGCLTCKNGWCDTCRSGYYFNMTYDQCNLCSEVLPNCITCSSNRVCDQCKQKYYWDTKNSMCMPCIEGCKACGSVGTCALCDEGYFAPNNTVCLSCANGCKACTNNVTNCTSCMKGFYLDTNSSKCLECNGVCSACYGPTSDNCTECISNATLFNSVCKCNENFRYDNKTCIDIAASSKSTKLGLYTEFMAVVIILIGLLWI